MRQIRAKMCGHITRGIKNCEDIRIGDFIHEYSPDKPYKLRIAIVLFNTLFNLPF